MEVSHSSSGAEIENPAYLVYEDIPRYDLWLKLILGAILALTLVLGIILLSTDLTAAWAMFGVTVFDALLFKAIMPQRYQIYHDRLKIVLGGPCALNIPLSSIREARSAPGRKAFAYWGVRFATSSKNVVEIVRNKGLNVVISPANRDAFLEQLSQALKAMPKAELPR